MRSIQEIQEEIIRDFQDIGDSFDQYSYLIALAAQMPPFPEEKRTEDRLVAGCQSKVWLDIERRDGRLFLQADSDTMVLRGMLKLLMDILSGQPLEEVAGAEISFWRDLSFAETFSTSRQKGLGYILETIRAAAGSEIDAEKP